MSSALSELAPPKHKWWRPFTKPPILSSFDNQNPAALIQNNIRFNHSTSPNLKHPHHHHHSSPKIFGTRLEDSLQLASVAISMLGQDHKAYIYGFIPVVVAKCGLYLKQDATLIEGIFRISGSTKRIKELQSIFDQPPFYDQHHPDPQSNGLQKPYFSIHDAANVLRRYLMCLPEPLISQSMYEDLKEVLAKYAHDQPRQIKLFKSLISTLSPSSQYLLLYLLDLLAVFANRSDKNLMTPNNLAVVFQPALCPANPTTSAKLNRIIYAQRQPKSNPPTTQADPQEPASILPVQLNNIQQESLQEQQSIMKEVKQAQAVIEFMILHQNHFVVGLRPQIKPTSTRSASQSSNHGHALDLKLGDRPNDEGRREEDRMSQPPSTPRPTSCQNEGPRPNTLSSPTGRKTSDHIRRSNTLPPSNGSSPKPNDWNGIMDHSVGSPVPLSAQPPPLGRNPGTVAQEEEEVGEEKIK